MSKPASKKNLILPNVFPVRADTDVNKDLIFFPMSYRNKREIQPTRPQSFSKPTDRYYFFHYIYGAQRNSTMKYFLSLFIMSIGLPLTAQDKSLPYYEIPDYPDEYTAGAVASRLVDGLGMRFYWATEGLREEDLAFKPSVEARTCGETIDHIYGMSINIVNATTKTINIPGQNKKLPFPEMRKATLENLQAASERLRNSSDAEMSEYKMIFQRGENTTEFPFWNEINGPISDCLWHVGQIISFRRSSGNPYNNKVSVLTGKVRQ